MSHLTICKISIRDPDLSLLKRTFEVLANEYRCKMTDIVRDYYGRTAKVMFGLNIETGIGVNIVNGDLVVVGDKYMLGRLFDEISQKIVQYYTALAVTEAAQQMGLHVEDVVRQEDSVIVYIRG